jgi:hypothetical protein
MFGFFRERKARKKRKRLLKESNAWYSQFPAADFAAKDARKRREEAADLKAYERKMARAARAAARRRI